MYIKVTLTVIKYKQKVYGIRRIILPCDTKFVKIRGAFCVVSAEVS